MLEYNHFVWAQISLVTLSLKLNEENIQTFPYLKNVSSFNIFDCNKMRSINCIQP
jgi:hypothetical protein